MPLVNRHWSRGALFFCVWLSVAACSSSRRPPAAAPAPESRTPSPTRRFDAPQFAPHCSDRWTIPGVPGGLAGAPHRALRRLGVEVRASRSADSTGIQLFTDPSPFPARFGDAGTGRFLLVVEMLPAHAGQADSTAMHLEVRVGPLGGRWLTAEDSLSAHHAAESLCAAALRATKAPRSSAKGRSA